jgi:hypothetical protein
MEGDDMQEQIDYLSRFAAMSESETTLEGYMTTRMELVTTEELASLLRRDPSTLRRWRTSRPAQGPPFLRLSGGVTMYDMADVRL